MLIPETKRILKIMNKTIVASLIVLAVIAGIVVFLINKPSGMPNTAIVTPNPSVAYFCNEGRITTTFGTSSVSLVLRDQPPVVLPQVVSGSGMRYERGDLALVGKGNNAFVTKGDKTIFNNCVAGTLETKNDNASLFTDNSKTFSLSVPYDASVSGGDLGFTENWRLNFSPNPPLGLVLVKITVPPVSEPDTNFRGAALTVGTSADPAALESCLTTPSEMQIKSEKVAIDNQPYAKITVNDAGAGNFYETTSYRTLKNNQCYTIEYTIHSTNIGNYSPDQGIGQFDREGVVNKLEKIIASFKFLP